MNDYRFTLIKTSRHQVVAQAADRATAFRDVEDAIRAGSIESYGPFSETEDPEFTLSQAEMNEADDALISKAEVVTDRNALKTFLGNSENTEAAISSLGRCIITKIMDFKSDWRDESILKMAGIDVQLTAQAEVGL